jgi:hypothetical protein
MCQKFAKNGVSNINQALLNLKTYYYKAGERGGGQNTRGPECSEGPGNLGKMFVLFIIVLFVLNEIRLLAHYPLIVVIDRKTYQM